MSKASQKRREHIGAVLTEEIFAMMKNNRPFDAAWFERELRALI